MLGDTGTLSKEIKLQSIKIRVVPMSIYTKLLLQKFTQEKILLNRLLLSTERGLLNIAYKIVETYTHLLLL